MKLNQVLAIDKSTKDRAHQRISESHHKLQTAVLLSGISRTYSPLSDDGEKFPPEFQILQTRTRDELKEVQSVMSELFDITAQKDFANCQAKGDVVLDDGTKILEGVPATYLLWIEKKLVDLHTFFDKLPRLPADEEWTFDENRDCFISKARETAKSKKIPKPFVKAEATKEHPAQVEVVHEDVLQGYWSTVKFSGALPAKRVVQLKARVEQLQRAVKVAREQANLQEAPRIRTGEKVFGFLLGE